MSRTNVLQLVSIARNRAKGKVFGQKREPHNKCEALSKTTGATEGTEL
jgi:hypothetical protein